MSLSFRPAKVPQFTWIPLTRGMFAKVDPADAPQLLRHKWHVQRGRKTCYAARRVARKVLRMHAEVIGTVELLDHKNGNGLDNRRENLRVATRSQNRANSRNVHNVSGFKGVYPVSGSSLWKAQIKVNGRLQYLGSFHEKSDAARAYDDAALKAFGEFAKLNLQ